MLLSLWYFVRSIIIVLLFSIIIFMYAVPCKTKKKKRSDNVEEDDDDDGVSISGAKLLVSSFSTVGWIPFFGVNMFFCSMLGISQYYCILVVILSSSFASWTISCSAHVTRFHGTN